MTGKVLNIQRFCTEDGPGIRTTVFLKGCPLRCLWCHNPESQRGCGELLYDREQCVGCLRCVATCPNGCHRADEGGHVFDPDGCAACGKCVSPLCHALELAGEEMTASAVLEEVRKDRLFYENSGGGLTLSGGEPLAQAEFSRELLRLAKAEGIHTAVETCGFGDEEVLRELATLTDLWLFDVKETDPARHSEYTGVGNGRILENLRLLDAMNARIVLRCPVIPGLNDRADHFGGIAALANELRSVGEIVVEPYHTLGTAKYGRLGRAYDLHDIQPPSDETVDQWIREIQKQTKTRVTRA